MHKQYDLCINNNKTIKNVVHTAVLLITAIWTIRISVTSPDIGDAPAGGSALELTGRAAH